MNIAVEVFILMCSPQGKVAEQGPYFQSLANESGTNPSSLDPNSSMFSVQLEGHFLLQNRFMLKDHCMS